MVSCKMLFALALYGSAVCAQHNEEALYLKKSRHLEIDVTGHLFKVTQTDQFDKSFNQNFEKHTYHSIFYSDFDPVIKLEAETLTPINGKMKRSKVSAFETKDIVAPGIFYGGYKRKEFVFPGVTKGSIGHLEVVHEIKDIHLLSPFYFTDDILVNHSEFSVSVPKNVFIQYRLFGSNKDQLEFKKIEAGNKTLYNWTVKDLQPYRFEKDSPGRSYSAPHIVIFIESYEIDGGKKAVLSDVSELYRWYNNLIQQIPSVGSREELDTKIIELIREKQNEKDKARAIFKWVQQNIKYIAFEDGMAGFIPRAANDVFKKRFGDCKDMANLLYYMLRKSDIKAYLTWIGTRDRPYTYQELPTPLTDNHMICTLLDGGQFYFLDATNPFLEFGKPSSMIQGKEALIGISQTEFKLEVVPIEERTNNQRIDTLLMRIDKTGVRGTFSGNHTGYRMDDWQLAKLKAQLNNEREHVRNFFKLGDNNIVIEEGTIKDNVSNVSFDFFQPGYYNQVGDRLFINLNFINSIPTDEVKVNRLSLIENDYRFEDKLVVKFEIPDGYTVKSMPSDTARNWNEFGIKTKYKITGSTILLERTIYCDYLYLDQPRFSQWNKFLEVMTSLNNQVVTFSK